MNWEKVYSYLKRNDGQINGDFTDIVMGIDPKEIQEGIQEYKAMQEKNKEFYNPIDWGVN